MQRSVFFYTGFNSANLSQTDLTEANRYREILRVQSITNTTTMVCERALHGTNAGDYDSTNWNVGHGIGEPIYLPFFNAHHDFDKYSVARAILRNSPLSAE